MNRPKSVGIPVTFFTMPVDVAKTFLDMIEQLFEENENIGDLLIDSTDEQEKAKFVQESNDLLTFLREAIVGKDDTVEFEIPDNLKQVHFAYVRMCELRFLGSNKLEEAILEMNNEEECNCPACQARKMVTNVGPSTTVH